MIDETGEGLIFILSQPRSGSTLLQRMLASHPEIHTTQEPWIALYPLFGLKDPDEGTMYNAAGERIFRKDFLDDLPTGHEAYLVALRRMLSYLYNQAAGSGRYRFFVDKSIEYYFIFPELQVVFPAARFVVLRRNPLAVLVSILTRWTGEQYFNLARARADLLVAPKLLAAGLSSPSKLTASLKFEDLVSSPERTIQKLCSQLSLPFSAEMLEPGKAPLPRWKYGDQAGVYDYLTPNASIAEGWKSRLNHPQIWRFARDYLEYLGEDFLAETGYEPGILRQTLADAPPPRRLLFSTFSLEWILSKPARSRSGWERFLAYLQRQFYSYIRF